MNASIILLILSSAVMYYGFTLYLRGIGKTHTEDTIEKKRKYFKFAGIFGFVAGVLIFILFLIYNLIDH